MKHRLKSTQENYHNITLIPVDKSEKHYHICKPWLEDKDITRWLSSILRFGKYFKIFHEKLISNKQNKLFFICINNKHAGLIGFSNIDRVNNRAEIWYLLGNKAERGKNIASQAVNLLKKIAGQDFKFFTLYAYVTESNIASVRVLKKNGFHFVGKFRKAFIIDDTYEDFLIFDWVSD